MMLMQRFGTHMLITPFVSSSAAANPRSPAACTEGSGQLKKPLLADVGGVHTPQTLGQVPIPVEAGRPPSFAETLLCCRPQHPAFAAAATAAAAAAHFPLGPTETAAAETIEICSRGYNKSRLSENPHCHLFRKSTLP